MITFLRKWPAFPSDEIKPKRIQAAESLILFDRKLTDLFFNCLAFPGQVVQMITPGSRECIIRYKLFRRAGQGISSGKIVKLQLFENSIFIVNDPKVIRFAETGFKFRAIRWLLSHSLQYVAMNGRYPFALPLM